MDAIVKPRGSLSVWSKSGVKDRQEVFPFVSSDETICRGKAGRAAAAVVVVEHSRKVKRGTYEFC